MKRMRTKLAIGTGAALVVVGGGAAVAAGGQRTPAEEARTAVEERSVRPPLHALRGGRAGLPHRRGIGLDVAAEYLGLTHDELREALRSGSSLAELARAEGRSVDGLVAALVGAARERLDAAVASGRLTDAQRDELLERLETRIAERVDASGLRHHRLRGLRGGGHDSPTAGAPRRSFGGGAGPPAAA